MPAHTPCAHCRSVGFVRWEHVVTAERSLTEFFCGRCDHAWTVADPERRKAPRPVKRHPSDAPRPSRS